MKVGRRYLDYLNVGILNDDSRREIAGRYYILLATIMMQRPPSIETERLLLVALVPEDIETLIVGDLERVSLMTGFTFLPEDPKLGADLAWHLRALRADSNQRSWRIRAIVERCSNTVVGSINLKGPPSADGDVEIGWGLIENARRKGYATEASAAVINWAVQQPASVPSALQSLMTTILRSASPQGSG